MSAGRLPAVLGTRVVMALGRVENLLIFCNLVPLNSGVIQPILFVWVSTIFEVENISFDV
jgi:hypothetical protein